MPTAEINETEIYYELRGKGSPLLMIMGWTANLDWWPETLLKGLEKKHRLILFDNRGAGRTQNTDGCYSISQFAGDAAALLKFLEIEQAHVFGVSMGGMIAQELTIRHPERVDKLILGCTSPGSKKGKIINPGSLWFLIRHARKIPFDIDNLLLQLLFSRDTSHFTPEHKEFIHRINRYPITTLSRWKQFWAVLRFNRFDHLTQIKHPTLVMTGSRDYLMPPRNSSILASQIPNSMLVNLEDCSHAFLSDAPDLVLKHIVGFLEEDV